MTDKDTLVITTQQLETPDTCACGNDADRMYKKNPYCSDCLDWFASYQWRYNYQEVILDGHRMGTF